MSIENTQDPSSMELTGLLLLATGAVREACLAHAKSAEESIDTWQRIADRDGDDETSRKYIAQYTAERNKYEAIAAVHTDAPAGKQ